MGAVVDRLGFVDRLWFMVDRLGFMVDRLWFMVDRLWFMVGGGGRVGRLGLRGDWGALVGDLRHVAVVMVCCVLHMLDTAVRKLDRVGPCHHIPIRCLPGTEVGLAVVICHGVLIAVWLRRVLLLLVVVHRLWFVVHRLVVDRL